MATYGRLLFTLFTTAALTAVFIGGCGGSATPASNGEASKPAAQILNDAATALNDVHSLRVQEAVTVASRRTSVTVALQPAATASVSLTTGPTSASVILVKGSGFLKASLAFYEEHGAPPMEANLIADRWIKVPGWDVGTAALTTGLAPATLSRCLVADHGTLSVGGKATVDGQPAVVVLDKGDRAGSTPSKLYVATTGAPLPLRAIATGAQRPGGDRHSGCNSVSDASQSGDELTFSGYNQPLKVSPPMGATDLTREPATSLGPPPALEESRREVANG